MTTTTDLRLLPAAVCAWLAAALTAGAPPRTAALVAVGLVAGGLVVAAATLVSGPSSGVGDRVRLTVVVALLAGAAAAASSAASARADATGPIPPLVRAGAVVEVRGVVVAPPRVLSGPGEDRVLVRVALRHVTGETASGPSTGDVLVTGDRGWSRLVPGSHVTAVGTLGTPWSDDGAVASLAARGPVDARPPPALVDRVTASLRAGLLAASAGLPPDSRGLVPGAAVGDTSRIPPALDDAMRAAGLTHMTAVSGGHFAVLAAAVALACGAARLPPAARAVASAVTGAGFVLLVQAGPAVLRAAAMAAVAVVALLLRRPAASLPALATAVVVLVVVDPWSARSYGFALSVVATAAIVLLAPALVDGIPRGRARDAALVVAVPAAAQAACAPVLVLLEPVVTPYAVLANVLAGPALVPATLIGVAATVVSPVWPAGAEAAAWCAHPATWWIATVARTVARLPGAVVPWPPGPGGALLLAAVTGAGVALGTSLRRASGVATRVRGKLSGRRVVPAARSLAG
ncbi:ComEC/Rec2 family competence protein [Actinotalea sp. AC32]|nr:ComEC/Rec2 family competence protein [Actinotalea sp. AC32]